jgi:POT family proton-dependent oligopeptide transporter
MPDVFRIFAIATKSRFDMAAARPSNIIHDVPWTEQFVSDLQRGLIACRVFMAYPILWLCHNQVMNNLISQAGQMETLGLPNDIFININPLAVLCLLPVIQNLLYPALRRRGFDARPIWRMAVGFLIEAGAMAYCTGVQQLIYNTGPCYDRPLECSEAQHGRIPNHINVWIQAPVYIIDALGEIFFDLAGQQYAYTEAPENMKSVMQGFLSMMSGLGTALGFALYPAARNPYLVYMFAALTSAMFVTTVIFWLVFHRYDSPEHKTYIASSERSDSSNHE